jgi:RNA polymerase sigma-70 factor (ECF subfamily)
MAWDDEEFAGVFNELYRDVRRFLECLLASTSVAQDIAQETFLRLYRKGGHVARSEARFWVFRVARNLALNELGKSRRQEHLTDEVMRMQQSKAPSPEQEYEHAERRRIVLTLLKALPELQRAALLLREQQEMSYAEIARVLGVSESKVKVDIHRARLSLRSRWNEIQNSPARVVK